MVAFSRLLTGVLTFASASIALAAPTGDAALITPAYLTCSADTPPVANLPASDESKLKANTPATPTPKQIVNVYWNIIYIDFAWAGGFVSRAQISDAMNTLNTYYTSTMTFKLARIYYHASAEWFHKADNEAGNALTTAMKKLLHQGTAKDLNIYSVGFSNSSLGGFATYPWWYTGAPELDGVVFKWNTILGGTFPNYSHGKTLIHQVGHWAGLYHTFQGGCSDTEGDYVSDTPAQAEPGYGCPVNRDSCPGLAGLDPAYNYMASLGFRLPPISMKLLTLNARTMAMMIARSGSLLAKLRA
ncbi:hypothetical protein CTheo_7271 [Ceratobasidium theobromae]|uniref:Peptidase M43 pregnancy-associated plasma-A domain-containing protein n=1 Tax=Ceratobasidium theobromae TaxID=1582974 RepID=A0A5N5QD81_9AGAM|nr:hypothetical protein CTheo_7271 [Ceratobasidium theobromae]